ncbi:MAG: ATP-binding cassette domain-containing protein [candidate division Zixibacteria bacterium]|nr:ATP-binding cassette domain-containing protein [candidate division Zixibacteria bacterium]
MSYKPLVNVRNLSLTCLDKVLIEKISFSVGRGEVVALIGANGSGKTTLLNLLHGTITDPRQFLTDSDIRYRGEMIYTEHIALTYLPQKIKNRAKIIASNEEPETFRIYDRLADSFALAGESEPSTQLSDGELQKRAIIAALMSGADLFFWDEPTNYLDIAGITAFEEQLEHLRRRGCGHLVVSHDRTLINNLADRTIYLTPNGVFQTEGGFSAAWSLAKTAYEARRKSAGIIRDKLRKLQTEMRNRLNWAAQKEKSKIGAGKEKPHIASISAKMAARAKAAQRKAEKEMERLSKTKPFVPKKVALPEVGYPVRHREVFALGEVSFAYRSSEYLLQNITLAAGTQDKLCLMGANGAGKSTLLKVILGQLAPLHGVRRLNERVKLRYLPQGLTGFFPKTTLLENFTDVGCDETMVRSYLGGVLLRGDKVTEAVTNFSQGELVRAAIVKCLMEKTEFLLLDEPTSHLDIESVEVLEQLLTGFAGGYLIISHDRTFVENIADCLYMLEDGQLRLV